MRPLEALVVVQILRAVGQGLHFGCDVALDAVDVDGSFLLEDGAAQRGRKCEDDSAEADLKGSADSRISEILTNLARFKKAGYQRLRKARKLKNITPLFGSGIR